MARMNSAKPNRKVVAGGISGLTIGAALTTIVVYVVEAGTHQPLPLVVQTSIGTLLTVVASFIASYLTSPGDTEQIVPSEAGAPTP